MELKIVRVFVLSLLVAVFSACSHCVNDRLASINSTTGALHAELEMRRCGSFEGWAVSVWGEKLPKQQILLIRMPPPTAVEDARNMVSIRWAEGATLIIEAPSWVKTYVAQKEYGPVKVKYEVNRAAYPSAK